MRTGRRKSIGKQFPYFVCFAAIVFCSYFVWPQIRKPVKPATLHTLSIVSELGTLVMIDGVRYGKTGQDGKLRAKVPTAGRREIRVRADGFKEASKILVGAPVGDVQIPLTKTSDEAELAFQEAERLSSSDREKAADTYLKAIRLRPRYIDAYIGLARVYSEAGSIDKAEKTIRDLRRIRPGLAEASAIQGRIYKDVGDETKAIAEFKKAITEGKGFQPEAYTGLGLLYKDRAESAGAAGEYAKETANYEQAAMHFAQAVKQLGGAPDAVVLYQLLGLVYEQQKKYKEAIAVYEEFLSIFPESSDSEAVRSFIVQLKKQMAEQE